MLLAVERLVRPVPLLLVRKRGDGLPMTGIVQAKRRPSSTLGLAAAAGMSRGACGGMGRPCRQLCWLPLQWEVSRQSGRCCALSSQPGLWKG